MKSSITSFIRSLSFSLVFTLSLVVSSTVVAEESATATSVANSKEDLLSAVKARRASEQAAQQSRVASFLSARNKQVEALAAARTKQQKLKARYDKLLTQFEEQEASLQQLQEKLDLQVGTLGEITGTAKEAYQSFLSRMGTTPLALPSKQEEDALAPLVNDKSLPAISQLYTLWELTHEELTRSGQYFKRGVATSDTEGVVSERGISSVGPFVFFDSQSEQQATWDAENSRFYTPAIQPEREVLQNIEGPFTQVTLDPTFGGLLLSLGQRLTWIDRLAQGGVVAYLILLVGISGLLVGLVRGVKLLVEARDVGAQSRSPEVLNASSSLGRVLGSLVENDLRLEEAEYLLEEQILKERSALEVGVPFVKLCATITPLMGLLGTVTGMIATFQSITVHGTSDPTLLAGGISQALVTTMVGLIVAVPLLFLHGLLKAPLNSILDTLEQQAAGQLARMQLRQRSAEISKKVVILEGSKAANEGV